MSYCILPYTHLSYRFSAGFLVWRLSHWILSASRSLLPKGGGDGGRADIVLAPPTLSEKWAPKPRLPAKVNTVLGASEERIIREKNWALNPCLLAKVKTVHIRYMPLKLTFRSHVEKPCDALSFKAT